jgi:hypothetical protein
MKLIEPETIFRHATEMLPARVINGTETSAWN